MPVSCSVGRAPPTVTTPAGCVPFHFPFQVRGSGVPDGGPGSSRPPLHSGTAVAVICPRTAVRNPARSPRSRSR
jgi:hypothetical protein